MTRIYFRVYDDGEAIVRLVECSDDGREVAFSDHSSNDLHAADGDGSLCPPNWSDAQAWTETTREHANTMLHFDLPTFDLRRT